MMTMFIALPVLLALPEVDDRLALMIVIATFDLLVRVLPFDAIFM